MEEDVMESIGKLSMRLYDDFAPVRAFIAEHPETKDAIVEYVGHAMSRAFATDFYGPRTNEEKV